MKYAPYWILGGHLNMGGDIAAFVFCLAKFQNQLSGKSSTHRKQWSEPSADEQPDVTEQSRHRSSTRFQPSSKLQWWRRCHGNHRRRNRLHTSWFQRWIWQNKNKVSVGSGNYKFYTATQAQPYGYGKEYIGNQIDTSTQHYDSPFSHGSHDRNRVWKRTGFQQLQRCCSKADIIVVKMNLNRPDNEFLSSLWMR